MPCYLSYRHLSSQLDPKPFMRVFRLKGFG